MKFKRMLAAFGALAIIVTAVGHTSAAEPTSDTVEAASVVDPGNDLGITTRPTWVHVLDNPIIFDTRDIKLISNVPDANTVLLQMDGRDGYGIPNSVRYAEVKITSVPNRVGGCPRGHLRLAKTIVDLQWADGTAHFGCRANDSTALVPLRFLTLNGIHFAAFAWGQYGDKVDVVVAVTALVGEF